MFKSIIALFAVLALVACASAQYYGYSGYPASYGYTGYGYGSGYGTGYGSAYGYGYPSSYGYGYNRGYGYPSYGYSYYK